MSVVVVPGQRRKEGGREGAEGERERKEEGREDGSAIREASEN